MAKIIQDARKYYNATNPLCDTLRTLNGGQGQVPGFEDFPLVNGKEKKRNVLANVTSWHTEDRYVTSIRHIAFVVARDIITRFFSRSTLLAICFVKYFIIRSIRAALLPVRSSNSESSSLPLLPPFRPSSCLVTPKDPIEMKPRTDRCGRRTRRRLARISGENALSRRRESSHVERRVIRFSRSPLIAVE